MTDSPAETDRTINGYIPALDGMRAIAIMLVVLSHAGMGLERMVPGTLGVVMFFVISGFLITRHMLAEIETTGTFNIGRFYMRRIMRLLPVLLAYITLFIPILHALGTDIRLVHVASALFYFANYYHLFVGYPLYSPFPILWSLSVEEHYYILFPFVMLALRFHPGRIFSALCVILAAVLTWRIAVYGMCQDIYTLASCGAHGRPRIQGTDMLFDCIMYGALAAACMHYGNHTLHRIVTNSRTLFIAGALLAVCLVLRDPFFRQTLRYSLEAIACAIIILHIYATPGYMTKILSTKLAIFIGKISYALYLVHFGVLVTIEAMWGKQYLNDPGDVALYLSASFLLATCFYFLLEKPMVEIRRRHFNVRIAS